MSFSNDEAQRLAFHSEMYIHVAQYGRDLAKLRISFLAISRYSRFNPI